MIIIKSVKIRNNIYFNMMPVTILKTTELKLEEKRHDIIIIDRSGSMHYELNSIIDSTIDYCNQLPEQSLVSVGYFSGTGQYNLSVAFELKKELYGLKTILENYKTSMGMTCFAEILQKINQIFSKTNEKVNLFFFTDGCPNQGGNWDTIQKELIKWKEFSNINIFIGAGSYIDREVMSKMANITSGSFIHLDKFSNFKTTLTDFGTTVEDSRPSVNIPIDFLNEEIIPISISGKSIVEYSIDNNIVKYKPSKKDFQGIYFLTKEKVKDSEILNEIDITAERGLRALAYIYSQKNDAVTSLEILNFIGDKYLVRNLYTAIIPEEFADAETKIRKSVFMPNERFLEGLVKGFLPDDNAFCVLDAINILCTDENVKLYIKDKDFSYNRIGKKMKQTDGSKVVHQDEGCKLGNIIMHKERLNLNINVSMKGIISLVPGFFKNNPFLINELETLNIPQNYPIMDYRTYNVICDGKLQTSQLVVSDLGKETVKALGSILTRRSDKKYIVDFTKIPILNKSYIKNISALSLAKEIWKEKLLTDQISYYNYLKKEQENKLEIKATKETSLVLSNEAIQFLKEHCYISGNSYSPPLEVAIINDEYSAYIISVEIKGFSKVAPKDIAAKLIAKKEPTQRELIIKECFDRKEDFGIGEAALICLNAKIRDLNSQLWPIRKNIQLTKFSIILGNKGKFLEFKERGTNSLKIEVKSLNGITLNPEFIFKVENVNFKI